jgi:hypothetical protein
MSRKLTRLEIRKFIAETRQINEEDSFMQSISKGVSGAFSTVSQAMGGQSVLEYYEGFEKVMKRTISVEINQRVSTAIQDSADQIASDVAKEIMSSGGSYITGLNYVPGIDITEKAIEAETARLLKAYDDEMTECANVIGMSVVEDLQKKFLPDGKDWLDE